MTITDNIKNILKSYLGQDAVSFLSHGKNYVSADIFAKGLAFLTIPIFTKLLVPEDYGKVALFSSFVSLFAIIFGWGIRGAISRYYYENIGDFNSYFTTNIISVSILNLFVISILFFFNNFISRSFSLSKDLYYYALIVALMQSVFHLLESYYIASKQSRLVARINVLSNTSIIAISILIIISLQNDRYLGKIWATAIVFTFVFLYSIKQIIKLSKLALNIDHIKYALIFGLPVVLHLISGYILSTFDRIIINQLVDEESTGLYSFAYQVGLITYVIYMGLLKAWTPMFYENLKNYKYSNIEKLSNKFTTIVLLISIGVILFSKEMVYIMADKKYYESVNMVPIIVIGYVFFYYYTMYAGYAFYEKKTLLISLFTILASVINVGLNYALIPKYGYQAASVTSLIAYIFLFLFHYLNVKYIIKFPNILPLSTFIIYTVLLILTYSLNIMLNILSSIGIFTAIIMKIIFILLILLFVNKILFSNKEATNYS